jgi:hypothetical protein
MSKKNDNENSGTKERENCKPDQMKANDTKYELKGDNKCIKPDPASKDNNLDKEKNNS